MEGNDIDGTEWNNVPHDAGERGIEKVKTAWEYLYGVLITITATIGTLTTI